ncbi:sulfatase/phosphatase domain-containing protein [Niabella ginsengisoli]|uniref:DUF4976 domain-containing protein n=1 Tax=Niabella ginsengisoli TaxID=522298 RepID=A0ABS9SGL6_9BACT|nr:sulfatase/phosphatase domain-containing protein [Niabella ginsengisoli]MCH5597507.1 DUF4976 domain-containing protein [Niabella ginsengisoli]
MNVQRSIRKGQYKLIVFPKLNKVLLFDLNNDPEEMHDLAGIKKYKSKVSELFEALLKKQQQMDDPLNISNIANNI